MDNKQFREEAHRMVDWMADYLENIEQYPVKSKVAPGDIMSKLPPMPPFSGEAMEDIIRDFNEIIIPGMTHWQSPNFFAYFPANNSGPSILAEMATATMGAQCMIWETSPAAAELEERVLNWLRDAMGLPGEFEGVIQDTASGASLAAIISAREQVTGFRSNGRGLNGSGKLRVYCSTQTHSSIEKAVKIAGLGSENLVRIPVDSSFAMIPGELNMAIERDISEGYIPCCVIATIGTTGTTAIDPIDAIGSVCSRNKVWLHVDAALAGTALILPEYSWMIEGKEYIDSFVFNPHKWMFTNFDCSVYYVRDAETLIRTFEILPDYLKTRTRGNVNDYRDWGIPLGRRFRALKLWFVIRYYGLEGLMDMVRGHISFASALGEMITKEQDFELLAPIPLNTVVFRYRPEGIGEDETDRLNEKLNHLLNDSGKIYLTHTRVSGKYALRMVTSQTNVTLGHVTKAWNLIMSVARNI